MAGIKETKEAVLGVMRLAAVIATLTKDGVQFEDFGALINEYQANPELKAILDAAYAEIHLVPEELKDLDFAESFELGSAVIKELPALVAAMK